jgi:hypothetical protein
MLTAVAAWGAPEIATAQGVTATVGARRAEEAAREAAEIETAAAKAIPKPIVLKDRDGRYSVERPVLTTENAHVAGLVKHDNLERVLTKAELYLLLELALQDAPPARVDPSKRADFEYMRESTTMMDILTGWSHNALLALHASRLGFQASEREIEEELNRRRDGAGDARGGAQIEPPLSQAARNLLIPGELLRQEVRDALLTEKLIKDMMEENYTDRDYREFYENLRRQNPKLAYMMTDWPEFWVFMIHRPIPSFQTTDRERRTYENEMKDLRRELSKRRPDFEELERARGRDGRVVAADLGWITGWDPFPHKVKLEIANLKVGETSPVFSVENTWYVVRLMDFKEGSGNSYEANRERVKNYFFGQLKERVAELLIEQGEYTVAMETEGLYNWDPITAEEAAELLKISQDRLRGDETTVAANETAAGARTSSATPPTLGAKPPVATPLPAVRLPPIPPPGGQVQRTIPPPD